MLANHHQHDFVQQNTPKTTGVSSFSPLKWQWISLTIPFLHKPNKNHQFYPHCWRNLCHGQSQNFANHLRMTSCRVWSSPKRGSFIHLTIRRAKEVIQYIRIPLISHRKSHWIARFLLNGIHDESSFLVSNFWWRFFGLKCGNFNPPNGGGSSVWLSQPEGLVHLQSQKTQWKNSTNSCSHHHYIPMFNIENHAFYEHLHFMAKSK